MAGKSYTFEFVLSSTNGKETSFTLKIKLESLNDKKNEFKFGTGFD